MEHKRFTNKDTGIRGVVPDGWAEAEPGVWLRHASETDQTHLIQQRAGGLSRAEIITLVISQESLAELPGLAGVVESPNLIWDWYRSEASIPAPKVVDLALAQHENWIYIVILGTTPGEIHDLHEAVFLPAIQALAPVEDDAEYARQLEAHAEEYRQMIRANRDALRNGPWPDFPTQSDQERGFPIPPPQQPYDASAQLIDLPPPDRTILTKPDLFECIADRKSHRKYTDESLTIQELAYLLWATQGVRKVTMGGKGSLRTVPSSGGRNPFETYLACESIGCGTCAIAAYRQEDLDRFLGLDGEDKLVVYLAPVGKVDNM